MIFWTKFVWKAYFWSKTEKLNITIDAAYTNALKEHKGKVKIDKESHWLQVSANVQPRLIRLTSKCQINFLDITWRKRYKTEKNEHHHWILILKLVKVPNFSLNWQFCFLDRIYPKTGKVITTLNFAYSNYPRYQISA